MRSVYDERLEELLKEKGEGPKERLLLHACCAPCSSAVIERLAPYFRLTIFFYNPNILEDEEYERRKKELIRFASSYPTPEPIDFLDADREKEKYRAIAKGREGDREGGERCFDCYKLRIMKTAAEARRAGFPWFCTTLSLSSRKNAVWINTLGEEAEALHGVKWLPSDFKKKNGNLRSIRLSEEYGLYRQDYCGCPYSKAERERIQAAKEAAKEQKA